MVRKSLLILLPMACLLVSHADPGRPEAATGPQDVRFCFVQVTDTHFGQGDALERARKVVESINLLPMKIECAVHTGDFTMDGIEDDKVVQDGLEVMGKLKVPVHYVAGNHDIQRRNVAPTLAAYRKHFGELAGKAEYRGVVFLMLYTELVGEAFPIEGYDPLKWLERSLIEAKGKPVIIFHHGPAVGDFQDNRLLEGWKKEPWEKWVKLVNSYNVKAVIAGHFHRDELHWIGSVPLYVCPAVSGRVGRDISYRVYEYSNGKVAYRTLCPN